MKGQFATGTQDGTGAAIDISCGFTPMRVTVFNVETGLSMLTWTDTMAADKGVLQDTAGVLSYLASGGITLYAGVEAGATEGFTIGTEADINTSGEALHWCAEAHSE
jgi:hypothetical protein